MYDYAHPISDSIEGITHSICTLEFEDHRPLYDWVLDQLAMPCHPQQIEFARLNLTYTVMSKRKLLELVDKAYVSGWDDPRMPTLSGLRRRGYTPRLHPQFRRDRIGVAKRDSIVDMALLEHCLREDLNKRVPTGHGRAAAVEGRDRQLSRGPGGRIGGGKQPGRPAAWARASCLFPERSISSRTISARIRPRSSSAFRPGREVRLKHAYYITLRRGDQGRQAGAIIELHCTYDPESRGGWTKDGRKVKGTSHWVSAAQAVDVEVRLYDKLLSVANPADEKEEKDFKEYLHPASLEIVKNCKVEPGLAAALPGERFQFLRQGYFCVDDDSTPEMPVFNRAVTLRDSWAKIDKSQQNKYTS